MLKEVIWSKSSKSNPHLQVVREAVSRTETVDHFPRKMLSVRRSLLGDGEVVDRLEDSRMEERVLLEAVLVVDEFCKELAAVAFVKYHCFS